MNKSGFNAKMNSEKIIYGIILVLVFVFILNMKSVYGFVGKIKSGEFFGKDVVEVVETTDDEEEVDKYTIVTPVGKEKTSCTLKEETKNGLKNSVVYLFYTDDKLKSLDEEVSYEGITDDYTNYIYSERKKYETRKTDNIKLEGYSVVTTLSGTMSLITSSVIDLSKTDITKITLSDKDGIGFYGVYDQNILEVKELYVTNGYVCE